MLFLSGPAMAEQLNCLRVSTLFFLILLRLCKAISSPCSTTEAVDITNGTVHANNTMVHNGVTYPEDSYFIVNDTYYGCVCLRTFCARKCCKVGYHYDEELEACALDSEYQNLAIGVHQGTKVVDSVLLRDFTHIGLDCELIDLDPGTFYLQKDGTLHVLSENISDSLPLHKYCLDISVDKDQSHSIMGLECATSYDDNEDDILMTSIGEFL